MKILGTTVVSAGALSALIYGGVDAYCSTTNPLFSERDEWAIENNVEHVHYCDLKQGTFYEIVIRRDHTTKQIEEQFMFKTALPSFRTQVYFAFSDQEVYDILFFNPSSTLEMVNIDLLNQEDNFDFFEENYAHIHRTNEFENKHNRILFETADYELAKMREHFGVQHPPYGTQK